MRSGNQESSDRRLNGVIDHSIREVMLRDRMADIDSVYNHLKASNSLLLDSMQEELAVAQIRIRIQHRLKHVPVIPIREAAALQRQQGESLPYQPYLPEMEQFRNIPEAVAIRTDSGRCIYIPYAETFESDRAMALLLLSESIAADQKLYHALKAGNEFASALVARYGDLPLRELVQLWLADGGAVAAI